MRLAGQLAEIKPELVGQWTCSQKVLDLVKTVDVSASGCGPPPCCCWELRETPGRWAGDWVRRARTVAQGGSDPFLRGQNGERKRLPGVPAEDSSLQRLVAGLFSLAQECSVAFSFRTAGMCRVGWIDCPLPPLLPICTPLLNHVNFSQRNRYTAYCRSFFKKMT